jgi:hypothetical protein
MMDRLDRRDPLAPLGLLDRQDRRDRLGRRDPLAPASKAWKWSRS